MSEVTESRKPASIIQVATASWIGTSIEWYDFFIFGVASALVINKLFFPPTLDPFWAQTFAFLIFWVGFLGRPIGGVIFGHFGDRIGRKAMLILTIIIMGLGTFLIGAMPTYQNIGLFAPIILVILRLAQGVAVGGEWGGAVLMATEHASASRKGFFGSWPQVGVPTGVILAYGGFYLLTLLFPGNSLLSPIAGIPFLAVWRIPFLISALLVVVGLFIRLRITETPDFARVKESGSVTKVPILSVLRHNFKTVLLAGGAFFVVNGAFYIFITFILTYNTLVLHLPYATVLFAIVVSAAVSFFILPIAGILSDRYGRLPVYLTGAGFTIVMAFPTFWLIDMKSLFPLTLALILGQLGISLMYGPQAAFFSELFGANVRYSGASLGYQGASILAGGPAPVIALFLLGLSHGGSWIIALYVVVMAVITFVSTYLAGETRSAATAAASASAGDD